MVIIPNFFENQLHFDPYLRCCYQYRQYIANGANLTHPGPFGACEDHLKFLADQISLKFIQMVDCFNHGNIELDLYKKYLLMYQQRLLTVGNFYSVPEIKQEMITAQIKLHLPQTDRTKLK